MPKIKYAIEKGGPKRLEVSWKGNREETTIRLDGNIIGSISNREQLETGKEFSLEDGSCLKVQLKGRSIFSCPRVLKDGQLLHPSGLDAAQRLSYTYKFLFMFAAVNLTAGFALLLKPGLLNLPVKALHPLIAGFLFLILAFFVMRKSIIALSAATGVLALDILLAVIFPPNIPRYILIAAIIFRILILFVMVQGFGSIKALKQKQTPL